MTTKFNKGIYAKMRSKKDKPLSNIGKKGVRVTGKGLSVTPVAFATTIVFGVETVRTASQPLQLKRFLLLLQKGHAYRSRRRKRLILARLPSGTTKDWQWKGHTRS